MIPFRQQLLIYFTSNLSSKNFFPKIRDVHIVALVQATTYACKDTIVTDNRLTNDAQSSADHDPIIGSLIY